MKCLGLKIAGKEAYFLIGLLLFAGGCTPSTTRSINSPIERIREHYIFHIGMCVQWLDSLQAKDPSALKNHYLRARDAFKRIEPMLAFAEKENYSALNAPNIVKVEEESPTEIKTRAPFGMQVLEELIFSDSVDTETVGRVARMTAARFRLMVGNADFSAYQKYHFLWMIRQAFTRVALTGITGFDSPVLQRSLQDAQTVYMVLREYLQFYEKAFEDPRLLHQWEAEIQSTIHELSGDFNSFDRYRFIKTHTHYQMKLWKQTVLDWQVRFPFELAIANDASSLFDKETFNVAFFTDNNDDRPEEGHIILGEKLFDDPKLSSDGTISCATCHQRHLAFTDGRKKSFGQRRNSPTLTYAGLQQQFFYDSRSGSLEGQILSVVSSPSEFHTDLHTLTQTVGRNPEYAKAFDTLYHSQVTDYNVRHALATYIRTLNDFDSRFDRGIRGEEPITDEEILGFNIFMGKARCATCHFPPVFNGTVPPHFTDTEIELIGVPASPDAAHAQIDDDQGRYDLFMTEQRRFFFKTPTVRNVALTSPYMHNGVYGSLGEVIDFYDRGGGAGIGISVEHQTLPAAPLDLTDSEKQALIAFLQSLSDKRFLEE